MAIDHNYGRDKDVGENWGRQKNKWTEILEKKKIAGVASVSPGMTGSRRLRVEAVFFSPPPLRHTYVGFI
jgi:hypothetical protein